jgi:hypothetical protein
MANLPIRKLTEEEFEQHEIDIRKIARAARKAAREARCALARVHRDQRRRKGREEISVCLALLTGRINQQQFDYRVFNQGLDSEHMADRLLSVKCIYQVAGAAAIAIVLSVIVLVFWGIARTFGG